MSLIPGSWPRTGRQTIGLPVLSAHVAAPRGWHLGKCTRKPRWKDDAPNGRSWKLDAAVASLAYGIYKGVPSDPDRRSEEISPPFRS